MRDADGTYLGKTECPNHRGVVRIEDRECCGGRKSKFAYIQCAKRGTVLAHTVCVVVCRDQAIAEKKE